MKTGVVNACKVLIIAVCSFLLATEPPLQTFAFANSNGDISNAAFESESDYTNPYLYNVVLSQNHSANSADTEGGIAVKGNSYILCENSGTFNYGAYFDNQNQGLGITLTPAQKVSLLLGGKIYNETVYQSWSTSSAIVGNGYFVMTPDAYDNWLSGAIADKTLLNNGTAYYDSAIESTFDALTDKIDFICATYDSIIANATTSATTPITGLNMLGSVSAQQYELSQNGSTFLVISVSTTASDESYAPFIDARNTSYDKIIVTTEASKVAFLDGNASLLGSTSQGSYNSVASKVDYYFPNAVTFTNYAKKDPYSAGNGDLHEYTDSVLNQPISSGSDAFSSAYFSSSDVSPSNQVLVGSVIAPKGTVIWSGGSINGHIYAKNFHQRNGAEAHNYISEYQVDFADMETGNSPDTSDLQSLITKASTLAEEDFDPSTWSLFRQALLHAQDFVDNISASNTNAEVEEELSSLNEALLALTRISMVSGLDTEYLISLVHTGSLLSSTEYTPATWETFYQRYASSRLLLLFMNDQTDQSEIDLSVIDLEEALLGLEYTEEYQATITSSGLSLSYLDALISVATKLDTNDYSNTSWENMSAVLRRSLLVRNTITSATSQDAIDEGSSALAFAINSLEKTDASATDYSILKALLVLLEDYDQTNYTSVSWLNLDEARSEAQDLMSNATTDTSQEEVQSMISNLVSAITDLDTLSGNDTGKRLLQLLFGFGSLYSEQDYTTESWQDLNTALEEALSLLENETASQADIDNSALQVVTSMNGLLLRSLSTTALEYQISLAENLLESHYTPETWAPFEQALYDAKNLIAGITENTTQSTVDSMTERLREAIKGLTLLTTGEVNAQALENLILEAERLEEGRYTTESWNTFIAALNAARSLLASGVATQDEINEAFEALTYALADLEFASDESGVVGYAEETEDTGTYLSKVSSDRMAQTSDLTSYSLATLLFIFSGACITLGIASFRKKKAA